MEIPVNNHPDYKQQFTEELVRRLAADNYITYYKSDLAERGLTPDNARGVLQRFVRRGYYAKLNWFAESWKGLQMIVLSKSPLQPANARLVYSEML